MPVHDVRRRLLRGLVSGSSSSTSTAALISPDQHNVGDDSGIDTPSGHQRRSYTAVANAVAPSSMLEDTFYGPNRDVTRTPDNMHAQPTLPGHRMRRKVPYRDGVQRHGQYVQPQYRGRAASPGLGSSSLMEHASVLDYRNDIVVRDPVTNEPNMVVLQTDVPLSEEIQEVEVMEYRVRKHLRNVYRNPKRQLEDNKLQVLVRRDLKRLVQELDEDAWMFDPSQEISFDLV
ncbi:hypothetical protein V1525DRAFT_394899 [Lipomyces kononenkoae]|uniref:Uncharacterized protein n=1 Tax=Lipomyces kononenkoae TaxID=34357 RepID=A0ACC3TAK2_LIPKO